MGIFTRKKKIMSLGEANSLLDELRIPVSLVFTPTNLEIEKKKFFNSDTYNPQFKYRKVKNNNPVVLDKLSCVEEIDSVDPRISDFYIDLIGAKKEANDLMNAVGDNDLVTKISVHRYGMPSTKLFRNACLVLKGKTSSYGVVDNKHDSDDKGSLGFDEIKNVFEGVFYELGLDGWGVSESINISKNGVKVGVKTKQILLNKNIERSRFKLRKTIVHEVGTHVLRAENGFKSGFPVLGKANVPAYLDVEEGLATYNESIMGLLTEKWLKNKAALVYAIYVGENMSFRELYNCLLGVLPKYSAFDTVYRVKRGLGDTSLSGIYAKDVVYFRGFRKVLAKLTKSPVFYDLLYSGKITFKQCEWVEEGLIPHADKVLTKKNWESIFRNVGLS